MSQIITIGEALVEIMRPDQDTPLDETGLFHGPFASGAPAIFAAAAARLGMQTGFIGSVGPDGFGRLIRRRLEDEGVDTSFLHEIPGYTTGIAFIAYRPSGAREFVFHLRQAAAAVLRLEQIDESYFADVSWLHISGSALFLSEKSEKACARALALTKKAGGRLSLDPNLRPELLDNAAARRVLAPYLAAADLLLPTVEEAQILAETDDDAAAAARLRRHEGQIVVLKRGAGGATVFAEGTRVDMAGYAVEEVDPTGAGDCFNAGFVYGLVAGWTLAKTAEFANAAGALAVTRQGPMEGAPTRTQVEALIASGGDRAGG